MTLTLESEKAATRTLINRANRLYTAALIPLLGGKPFYLAGGALMKEEPNDYDLYPAEDPFDRDEIKRAIVNTPRAKVIFETGNALTVRIDDQTVQFCSFSKPSLEELCNAFDFAHCQAGVLFVLHAGDDGNPASYRADYAYASANWVRAKLQESTFYTGSEYPLGALLRIFKYAGRGLFTGKSYYDSVFLCLHDLMNRGFRDRDDFKSQLESIDLGITDNGNMDWLYEAFDRNGLVKSERTARAVPGLDDEAPF